MKVDKKKPATLLDTKLLKRRRKTIKDSQESTIDKAVKHVSKILGKTDSIKKDRVKEVQNQLIQSSDNDATTQNKSRRARGLIIISHIPHGFYEQQMEDYFSQFGKVTRVRVARSKNTGSSKGYGYVEFLHPAVAQIAAETMNNYLMYNRFLKVMNIPPEKQHGRYFTGRAWSSTKYPKLTNRKQQIKEINCVTDVIAHKKKVKKSLRRLSMIEKKVLAKGISLKFHFRDLPKESEL